MHGDSKEFNFLAKTYLIPEDKEIVEKNFKDYKLNLSDLWIIKPRKGRLGVGIRFFNNLTDLNDSLILMKYL